LRYVIQLLTPAKLLAQVNGREEVTESDIRECAELFIDAKKSAELLKERPQPGGSPIKGGGAPMEIS